MHMSKNMSEDGLNQLMLNEGKKKKRSSIGPSKLWLINFILNEFKGGGQIKQAIGTVHW